MLVATNPSNQADFSQAKIARPIKKKQTFFMKKKARIS